MRFSGFVLTLFLIHAALAADAPSVRLPDYTRQVLGNGAVILLAPKPEVPLITAQIVVKGGAESDSSGMAGLAMVTADLLRAGTQKRSANQISDELDSLGADFRSYADRSTIRMQAEFLNKDTDKMIELLADMFVRANFPEAEVKKVLARRIDSARAAKDNPAQSIGSYFQPFFYGAGHPYSRSTSGDEVSLARITRDAVVAYHKKMFVAKNLIVVVSGDFDPKQMAGKLGMLKWLSGGDAYAWAQEPAPLKFESSRLLLVDKPDATQTYFLIGQPGISRTSPDRTPLLLVNTLFGGRFTSLLNDELRVNTGLTYGARSQLERNRLNGALYISTFTKTETTQQAIDLALDVLKRLRDKGIDAEQLASAKAYIKGLFPTDTVETADQIANVLIDLEVHALNKGEIDDLFSRIDAVTLEQANAIAKKYYNDANLQFLLIGNASKIKDVAAKYSPKMKVIPVSDPGYPVVEF